MGNDKSEPKKFSEALAEHGPEGIEVLLDRSSFAAHALIYLLCGLLLAILVWSFFARADVIVSVTGYLAPESDTRRVYAPTDGELVELYVTEGTPVAEGDLLARIKAPDAIRAATAAFQAKLRFEESDRERELFPQKKSILERELAGTEARIARKEREYEATTRVGLQKVSEEQRSRLAVARRDLEEARRAMEAERELHGKYVRLFSSTAGGGISKKQVSEQRNAFLKAVDRQELLKSELEGLELDFSKQYSKASETIDELHLELLRLRLELERKKQEIENAEIQAEMKYRAARAEWEEASLISFEDLDRNNFLEIRAPLSGEVTDISFTQAGEKVLAIRPLVTIAPEKGRKMLFISVLDRDRGLLKPGQGVKMKFAAFPYHRYGFVDGTLEYLSPAAKKSQEGQPAYEGKVSLARDFFVVNGENVSLRYGMGAVAEIVVQKRRLIEFVLDPFRK